MRVLAALVVLFTGLACRTAAVHEASRAGEAPGAEVAAAIREAIAVGRHEDARAHLHRAVAELGQPGAEEERIALLVELEQQAQELGELEDSARLCAAILALRLRLDGSEGTDVLRAKLALSRASNMLGDLPGALALQEEVLAIWERELPPDHADLLDARGSLALTRLKLGDREGARALLESLVDGCRRALGPDYRRFLRAKYGLGWTEYELGNLAAARALFQEVVTEMSRFLPPEHGDLLDARQGLAATVGDMGDLEGERAMEEELLLIRGRSLPPEHPVLLSLQQNLAVTTRMLGHHERARELEEEVLRVRSRRLPPDHLDLVQAKENLAVSRQALGDLQVARELAEQVLEVRARLLSRDHPLVLRAQENLLAMRRALGDLAGAREIEEQLFASRVRRQPPDHPDLLFAMNRLADTRRDAGDMAGARELREELLAARARLLPPDHLDLLIAKEALARLARELGDLAGARRLGEEVCAAHRRLLAADSPDLQAAKLTLAAAERRAGDVAGAEALEREVLAAISRKEGFAVAESGLGQMAGACELFEQVLAERAGLLPPEHPEVLAAKGNLAVTRHSLGDLAGARALEEEVLATRARLGPSDEREVLSAKATLALTMKSQGDLARARELEEQVLAARTRLLAPGHPEVLSAKEHLAWTLYLLGDLADARRLREEVLAGLEQLLPIDHHRLVEAKRILAWTAYQLGDLAGANELVSSLLAGLRVRAAALRSESVRSARESARAELLRLSEALFLGAATDERGGLEAELFATLETLRLASVANPETAQALEEHPELGPRAREIGRLRSKLNDLVAAGPGDRSLEGWREELLRLASERDRLERLLRSDLAAAGVFVEAIEAGKVAASLDAEAAAVSFLRYSRQFARERETGATPASVDSLLAFVVPAGASGGGVRRVELGPAAELEELVREWRLALGRPLEGRGLAAAGVAGPEATLEDLGRRLRERILDPVLAQAGAATTLHVVLDDVLHLIPLDALPLEGGLVGERIAVRNEVSLARLLRPRRASAREPALTLCGGIDYDAELGEEPLVPMDAPTPPVEESLDRSQPGMTGFAFLPGTAGEVASIADLFHTAFEREARTLSGAGATKAALHALAPSTGCLHLATHGWFAPEILRSELDGPAGIGAREDWLRAEEALLGFAPETLCGLALTGANRGRDASGRVPGILTAEELATVDLRNCALAVLSACETNVGIRRAGQGIQSLQAALHAAGALTAVTSLWRVDDQATRRLMELFYAGMWEQGLAKSDALWQAKMTLRAEGHPPRDWAGWVLTGDPR